MRSLVIYSCLGLAAGFFVGCFKSDNNNDDDGGTDLETQVCMRLEECNAIIGTSVAECSDEVLGCTAGLNSAEREDFDRAVADCLSFNSCGNFLDCYVGLEQCGGQGGTTTNSTDPSTTSTTTSTTTTTTSTTTDTGGQCVPTGMECTENGQCCDFPSNQALCVDFPGFGVFCAATCDDGTQCASGCCAGLEGGGGACAPPQFCG